MLSGCIAGGMLAVVVMSRGGVNVSRLGWTGGQRLKVVYNDNFSDLHASGQEIRQETILPVVMYL